MYIPELQDIREAHQRIAPFIHKTPVMTSENIDHMFGCSVFFKCENLQKTGSFKMRGAMNAILSLPPDADPTNGVATHSSGNHAAALAVAAQKQGIPCTIIMPNNAPSIKRQAVLGYGARIIDCEPTMASRIDTINEFIERSGAHQVPPYNDSRIIAGQGTAVLELLASVPNLNTILVPVGGGGLASGTCIAVKAINPGIRVIGVEPEMADDALRSLKAGKIVPSDYPPTVADGLRSSLGELTFAVLQEKMDDILTVSETEIVAAMRLIWERMKIIIEPSAAVPVAALMHGKIKQPGKQVGILLSGGNVALDSLPWYK